MTDVAEIVAAVGDLETQGTGSGGFVYGQLTGLVVITRRPRSETQWVCWMIDDSFWLLDWVWINTYENTIFRGLFTSILTQLFWGSLGVPGFWPIPGWKKNWKKSSPFWRVPCSGCRVARFAAMCVRSCWTYWMRSAASWGIHGDPGDFMDQIPIGWWHYPLVN